MNKEAILNLIKESFPQHSLNGGIFMSQAQLRDDRVSEESIEYREAYKNNATENWKKVNNCSAELFAHLCPKGIRYHLPVVLSYAVLKDNVSIYDLPYCILPSNQSDFKEWNPSIFVRQNDLT